MDLQMLDMAIRALDQIFDPERLLFLLLGTLMGLIVGAIPGVGGLVGLTLLLPFTFGMDPYSAIAVMMGLLAVTTTSDTIPAVLFGVPGTVGSAATILDGYPLAKDGQAGRALGAGKHVLAEKPMATTRSDLDVLRRACATSDRHLWTMLPMVYDPGFLGMKKIVQDGVIGEVVQVYALKSYPYHDSRPQEHEVDGGLLMQAGIHAVSLVGHVTGRTFEEVFAQETATGNPKSGELQMGATVACRLEGGALATVLCNYCNPPGIGYHGNDQIRVHGTKGMIELVDGFTRRRLVAGNRAPESFPDVPPVRTYPQDMIDAVLDGSPTLLTEADGFHFTEVVIRARESVGEARPLHVAG